jgi:hypothetical protein
MSMVWCQSPLISAQIWFDPPSAATVSSRPPHAAGPQPQIWPAHSWLQPLAHSAADWPSSHDGVGPPISQEPSSLVAPLALLTAPQPSTPHHLLHCWCTNNYNTEMSDIDGQTC